MSVQAASRRALRMIASSALAILFTLAQSGLASAETAEAQTATADADGQMHLPARTIPLPSSISPDAQKFLATGIEPAPAPPSSDKAAWHSAVEQFDKVMAEHTEAAR